jgi:hypothetical protein
MAGIYLHDIYNCPYAVAEYHRNELSSVNVKLCEQSLSVSCLSCEYCYFDVDMFSIVHYIVTYTGEYRRFWIGWLDLLTPYHNSGKYRQLRRCYWSTHFTVHRCTRTRVLKSSLVVSCQSATWNHTRSLLCTVICSQSPSTLSAPL